MAGGQDFRKRTREECELVQEFKRLCMDETSPDRPSVLQGSHVSPDFAHPSHGSHPACLHCARGEVQTISSPPSASSGSVGLNGNSAGCYTRPSLGGRMESSSSSSCGPGGRNGHPAATTNVISSHYSSFLPPKLLMGYETHVDGTGAGGTDAQHCHHRLQNTPSTVRFNDGDPTGMGELCNTCMMRNDEDMEVMGVNPSLPSPNTGHNSFMRMDISEGERDFLSASPSGSRDECTLSPSRTGSDWPQAFGSLARAPLFQDEDGDVAHGFFEEVIESQKKPSARAAGRSSRATEVGGGKNTMETDDEEMSFALVPWAPVNSTSHLRQRIDLLALPMRALKALAAKVNTDPYKRRYLLEKSDLVDLVMQDRDASAPAKKI